MMSEEQSNRSVHTAKIGDVVADIDMPNNVTILFNDPPIGAETSMPQTKRSASDPHNFGLQQQRRFRRVEGGWERIED